MVTTELIPPEELEEVPEAEVAEDEDDELDPLVGRTNGLVTGSMTGAP